jgi:hypothetical protein
LNSYVPLAVAGDAPLAQVDPHGYLHWGDGWRLEWWIAGDDYWHVPAASPSLRQRSVDATPVVETAMHVPGGDVVWRVAATATADGGAIVAELENRAAIPVAIGIALIAPNAEVTSRPSVHFVAPARSVAAELGVELLVHPVTHGSTWRCSLGGTAVDALPPIDAIVRGWQVLSRQGAQVDFGDATANDALAAARATLLLHAGDIARQGRRAGREVAAPVISALTLLGHEDEAERLRVATHLKPRRRGLPVIGPITPDFSADPLLLLVDPPLAAATITTLRNQLVDDSQRRTLDLLPAADASWRGRSIDVTNLPTNRGPVSFSLRWHGDHPALLWDAPKRATLRASALKPEWSTRDQTGEELLPA